MRVLVTGHDGYIGAVLVPFFQAAGHQVIGLDTYFYEGCDFGKAPILDDVIRADVRAVTEAQLQEKNIDGVVHLAALSNDPIGNLNPRCTYDINAEATVELARKAKAVGIERFAFSSSCSIYGAADPDDILDESAQFNPVTPYGESKVISESGLSKLADDNFSPTYLRNATAYGASPKLRADLVVNNLVGWAYLTGAVLIKSDGTPWRPLVHIEDITRAFMAVLQAPRDIIHDQPFNVGRNGENYQIRDIANHVERVVHDSKISYAEDGGPDDRCYRVDFSKIERELPNWDPQWTVPKGIEELVEQYRSQDLQLSDFEGNRFMRINTLMSHIEAKRLDLDLRWQSAQ